MVVGGDVVRKCLEEFIEMYKNVPCLWLVKSKDYHNREVREAAYLKLAEKLKEIDPTADKESVVRKINSLRNGFRKEIKKMQESLKWGAAPEDTYKPKLWYFGLLSFLIDQEQTVDDIEFVECNEDFEEMIQESSYEHVNEFQITASEELVSVTPRVCLQSGKKDGKSAKKPINNSMLAVPDFKRMRMDDRFDDYGKNVASKLRDLPKFQRLIAEKLINEALFHAELGHLTMYHSVGAPSPPPAESNDEKFESSTTETSPISSNQTTAAPPTYFDEYGNQCCQLQN